MDSTSTERSTGPDTYVNNNFLCTYFVLSKYFPIQITKTSTGPDTVTTENPAEIPGTLKVGPHAPLSLPRMKIL